MKKACIIGFGKLGLLHCCLINNYKNFKVTTIIEKNYILKLLLKIILPSEFSIYNNINNKNLQNIDLVVIATQPGQTPKIIKKLYDIKFKKDVFLEKPGFINISDFYNNLNFIKSFRKFKVGYMLRYKKTFKILNKIIKDNKYGKPEKSWLCLCKSTINLQ